MQQGYFIVYKGKIVDHIHSELSTCKEVKEILTDAYVSDDERYDKTGRDGRHKKSIIVCRTFNGRNVKKDNLPYIKSLLFDNSPRCTYNKNNKRLCA